jgi:tyrosyl-DNA phosphodiesterase 2
MEEIVTRAIKTVELHAKTNMPWTLDEPHKQPFYEFNHDEWHPHQPADTTSRGPTDITRLALYAWNIDFMLPFPGSRMRGAISHLQDLIASEGPASSSTATIIYLQECVRSDLDLLASHAWIRDSFVITDLNPDHWQSGYYGTVSLVDRRLPITECFRVHYAATRMQRDVLIVDVRVGHKTVRCCNTHLESLALEPPYRIPQMELIAEYMKAPSIDGALVAGDFNAVQSFDRTLHSENGLKDAYLEMGGDEDDPSGHTWGQQAASYLRTKFGTSRMDKVYFHGNLTLESFEQFGADVMVEDKAEQDHLVQLGFDKPWITDHMGVKAVFRCK